MERQRLREEGGGRKRGGQGRRTRKKYCRGAGEEGEEDLDKEVGREREENMGKEGDRGRERERGMDGWRVEGKQGEREGKSGGEGERKGEKMTGEGCGEKLTRWANLQFGS